VRREKRGVRKEKRGVRSEEWLARNPKSKI
jgi:hypothetical protein